MTLKWRLTLVYTALLACLLGLVSLSALGLMQRSLRNNLDAALSDNYRVFTRSAGGTLASGPSWVARYTFPNNVIQVEDLGFYDQSTLSRGLSGAQTPEARAQFLKTLRSTLNSQRRVITGLSPQRPFVLTETELTRLAESPGGRILIQRSVNDIYGEPGKTQTTPYRILVALGMEQLEMPRANGMPPPPPSFAITYIGLSLTPMNDTMRSLKGVFAVLFFLGTALSALGAYLLAGQALLPLRQVRQAAERIGGQNLGERVPEPQTQDEVQALAGSLNAMLDRLEKSFEAQRRFTSDASHELRTPVTAISGHANYLLRRTDPTGQQQESLRIIQSESARLTNLIASLLELARSDSGALVMSHQPILSSMFLTEIVRELAPLAHNAGTALSTSGQDITFEGDPDRLKQVMINLVGNALKAGARNITLSSKLLDSGQKLQLSVRDDGPGIPAEHLAKLFDRFYRVEDSRSRDQGGAGLGLSIAKGIVDAHGGKIWIESEIGQGTDAFVELPVGDVPVFDEDDVP
ncbi:cell wall metabolism sensor histidine kinase WalK [Deinococcus sp.]|uniref:sensor histidine kinase n=1 Tax=Deinococcus sp. TaxID=47478 RepID=UPI0025BE1770|nr:HAMP domain-containing sensor histidine kinase [Deinococcus sp.]